MEDLSKSQKKREYEAPPSNAVKSTSTAPRVEVDFTALETSQRLKLDSTSPKEHLDSSSIRDTTADPRERRTSEASSQHGIDTAGIESTETPIADPSEEVQVDQTAPEATSRQEKLLQAYLAGEEREVDANVYIDSQKLRTYATITKPKQHSSRFIPGVIKRFQDKRWKASHPEFEAIASGEATKIMDWLNQHSDVFSRTRVMDTAAAKYVQSLGRSEKLFKAGVASAQWAEEAHSTVTRSVQFLGILGAYLVLNKVADPLSQKIGRFLLHQVPVLFINPWLNAKIRSMTDVLEKGFMRVGGEPTIVKNVDKSPNTQTIFKSMVKGHDMLNQGLENLEGNSGALGEVIDAALALFDTDSAYKERGASKRIAWAGKLAGGGAGLLQSGSNIASSQGHPLVGLVLSGGAVGAQALAGLVDEPLKHKSTDRNNAKHSSKTVLDSTALNKPFVEWTATDVVEDELRKLHMSQAQSKIDGVREVLTDDWSKLTKRILTLRRQIAKSGDRSGTLQAELDEKTIERVQLEQNAAAFESFDPQQWKDIPAESRLGKCLDSDLFLYTRQAWIRTWSPAERAQKTQRDFGLLGGYVVSAGILLPAAEGITLADWSHEPPEHHDVDFAPHDATEETPLLPKIRAGVGAMTGTSTLQTAALVGEVRKSKQAFKNILSKPPITKKEYDDDKDIWTFKAGDKVYDARTTRPYLLYKTNWFQRRKQVLAQYPAGLMTGPKGLYYQAKVRGLTGAGGARGKTKKELQRTVQTLKAQEPAPPEDWNRGIELNDTVEALKFEFLSLPVVQAHLARRRAEEARLKEEALQGAENAPEETHQEDSAPADVSKSRQNDEPGSSYQTRNTVQPDDGPFMTSAVLGQDESLQIAKASAGEADA